MGEVQGLGAAPTGLQGDAHPAADAEMGITRSVSHACYLQAVQKGSFPVRTEQEKPNKCFGCSPSLELGMSRTGTRRFG